MTRSTWAQPSPVWSPAVAISTRSIHSARARLEDLLVDRFLRREVVQHARIGGCRQPRRCRSATCRRTRARRSRGEPRAGSPRGSSTGSTSPWRRGYAWPPAGITAHAATAWPRRDAVGSDHGHRRRPVHRQHRPPPGRPGPRPASTSPASSSPPRPPVRVPVTIEPHLVVIVRCRPGRARARRPRGRLPAATASRSPATCSRSRSSRASSTTGWSGPSSPSTSYGTVEAHCRIDLGPVTVVPLHPAAARRLTPRAPLPASRSGWVG